MGGVDAPLLTARVRKGWKVYCCRCVYLFKRGRERRDEREYYGSRVEERGREGE